MSLARHPAIAPSHLAVIAGSSSGIGLALSKFYASQGMHVAMGDINAQQLQTAAEEVKKEGKGSDQKILPVTVDVSDEKSVQGFKDEVLKTFPSTPLTVLHANAGVGGPTSGTSLEGWSRVFGTNFHGVLHVCAVFVPVIQQQLASSGSSSGSGGKKALVITTGSKQGITKPPGSGPAYNASKAAVLTYTEAIAHELRSGTANDSDKLIDVRLLVPGWVWTPLAGAASGKPKPDGAWSAEQTVAYLQERLASSAEKNTGEDEGRDFYIVCPDGETSEQLDKARQAWSVGDVVENRPALSRWHPAWKARFDEFMKSKGF